MGVLSGAQIKRMVESGELLIEPFEDELVQPATYDLRVGHKILASPLSPEILGATVELNDKTNSYNIQSGQMISVLSFEKLELPLTVCGRPGIKSSFARQGINAFGGVQLDPGFRGRLFLNLLNVGPEAVAVTQLEPMFTVEYQRLEEPAELGYVGSYQDQDDFPPDQYDFILNARTTSLAEIPTLRLEVSRLNVLIQELEEKLPDPDEGLDLRSDVEERLQASLGKSGDALVSIEDIRERIRRRA